MIKTFEQFINKNVTKTYYKSDLPDIIEMCQDYIDQCSKYEQETYQQELNDVCGDFNDIINSDIFHDAIGKVVNIYDNRVEVTTEY